ncbi:Os08g0160400 [Oryza sativa Japonica Group]|uniref:Os08g0160400 protein n=1 Tax=Oryza sativa subsp. japonica TaxID=39947 RepID=C7J616_ORYSJ|nr:Os08g0160400 [Oryza sativa Japonica Group]|eukprot:NP_001175392.1 Os08g0160400 [Oryza sativa Japonica Group]
MADQQQQQLDRNDDDDDDAMHRPKPKQNVYKSTVKDDNVYSLGPC